jgi:hypothetical protein
MFKKRGQGQSWSLDIILAFVIFVLIIGIFYALLSNNKGDQTQSLMLESNTVLSNLDMANGQNNNLTIIEKGSISEDRLKQLYVESDYDTLKKELGIKGDFCIYLVRQDGSLVTITKNVNGEDIKIGGFGNGNYTVNGAPCGYNVTV